MFIGLIFIIIGAAFLLQNLGYIPASAWGVIWPALLMALGLRLLFKKSRGGFFWEEEFGWRKKGMRSKTIPILSRTLDKVGANASESTNIIKKMKKKHG